MSTGVVPAGLRAGFIGGVLALALEIFQRIPLILNASLTAIVVVFLLTWLAVLGAFALTGAVAANLSDPENGTLGRSIGAAIIAVVVMIVIAGIGNIGVGIYTLLVTGGASVGMMIPSGALRPNDSGFESSNATILLTALNVEFWMVGVVIGVVVAIVGAVLYARTRSRRDTSIADASIPASQGYSDTSTT